MEAKKRAKKRKCEMHKRGSLAASGSAFKHTNAKTGATPAEKVVVLDASRGAEARRLEVDQLTDRILNEARAIDAARRAETHVGMSSVLTADPDQKRAAWARHGLVPPIAGLCRCDVFGNAMSPPFSSDKLACIRAQEERNRLSKIVG